MGDRSLIPFRSSFVLGTPCCCPPGTLVCLEHSFCSGMTLSLRPHTHPSVPRVPQLSSTESREPPDPERVVTGGELLRLLLSASSPPALILAGPTQVQAGVFPSHLTFPGHPAEVLPGWHSSNTVSLFAEAAAPVHLDRCAFHQSMPSPPPPRLLSLP